MLSRPASILALALLTGCRSPSPGESTPAPADAVPPPLASSAAPLPPPTAAEVQLVAMASDLADSRIAARVELVIPALQLRQAVAELEEPWACTGAPEKGGAWVVRCTPHFRKVVAEITQDRNEIILRWGDSDAGRQERRLSLAPGQQLATPASSTVTARDPFPTACAENPGGKKRKVEVTLPAAHYYPGHPRNDLLYLAVPGAKPFTVVEQWAWTGCKAKEESGVVEVSCPPGPKTSHGRFSIAADGASVDFEWEDDARYLGKVVLPCNVEATVVRPESFAGGNSYY